MSPSFALTPDAEADVQNAKAWYEQQRAGRGDEFVVELHERISDICLAPYSFGRVRGKIHAARMRRSQFVVYFRIEPIGIVVIAVQHTRAHPNKWKRRR